ncbi:SAV_2336 N-terminal domain-related protein [Streptomyces sp. NPDC008086]|uniref:SAV_2336 N-terminal domain-related protein n=1 Tax=Streptomyces sp. NPDC008086 TaxID=3364807 RepID=UPI0036E4FA2A
MSSERAGRRPPLVRLADVLAEAGGGVRPTPLELAELLWLARHMEPAEPTEPAPEPPSEDVRPAAPRPDAPSTTPSHPPGPPRARTPPRTTPPRPPRPPRAPLHLPAPHGRPTSAASAVPHATLLAPAPPMLRNPLALQRSLRPLKRRTDAPDRLELDERATADRIARLGAAPEWWLPVLRPARERWLRLTLVYDAGPTMAVWRPLVRELHTVLAQSGVFRTVTLHRADPDSTVRPGTPAPTDGRTVTLLVSDCMGPQWRQGPVGTRWFAVLRRWARRMPLAVVQPLPEHLWRDTALPAAPGLLSAPYPAAPSASLTFLPYDEPEEAAGARVAVPVLEPGPDWLANWVSLVASTGGRGFPGAAARLSGPPPADSADRTDLMGLSPEELVLRFRATASPEAFRLAGHLALGRPDLPVMRLLHATLEPRPRPQHLAEVILSGMLTGVPGPPGSYAFRDGVRELLLRSLPRTARVRTTELLADLGALIDTRAGLAPGEFRALAPAPSGTRADADGDVFATVDPESVRRLSDEFGPAGATASQTWRLPGDLIAAGRYRLVRRLDAMGTHWLASDTREGDEQVMVRTYPRPPQWFRASFPDIAERLSRIRHPGIGAVRDFGIEDDVPYLVRDFIDGRNLRNRLRHARHGLPGDELLALVPPLVEAVDALHTQGRPHGGLDTSHVIITAHGPVLSCLDAMSYGTGSRQDDLRALGHIVRTAHRGTDGPDSQQLPLPLDDLAVPAWLSEELDSAVAELTSEDADTQLHGVERLLRLPALGAAHRTDFSLLGPLRITRDGRPLAKGSPQEQAMLAMLLLHNGGTLSHAQLVEGIWGRRDDPARAAALVGSYASRLHNALGPDVLVRQSDGYALRAGAVYVDVIACQRLVERAKAERSAGNIASAREATQEALSLWRGTALDGIPGPAADAARTRLLQLRLSLCATRAELDLEVGEFGRAAVDLAGLVDDHPAREDLRRLFITALRRQGRVEEALEVYEEYELSGGQNPELLVLGRELRDEFGDVPDGSADGPGDEELSGTATDTDIAYGFVTAPDELSEGFIPAEDDHPRLREELSEDTPLPQDHVPDSLFAVEDTLLAEQVEDAYDEPPEFEPDDEPETDRCDCACFEFVDGPPTEDARDELHRLVTILLEASGLAAAEYVLGDTDRGFTLLTRPFGDASPLLRITVAGLAELLGRLEGRRLRVVFWEAEFGPNMGFGQDESAEHGDRPATEAVVAELNMSGQQAIIAVSEFWHSVVFADNSIGTERFTRLRLAPGWYRTVHPAEVPDPSAAAVLVDMTDVLRTPAFTGPPATAPTPERTVAGPFPMPRDGRIPPHPNEARIVLRLRGGELVPADFALVHSAPAHVRAGWQYFAVDLTERRLAPEQVPGVEVRWRVSDPVAAAADAVLDVPGLLTATLLGARGAYGNELREVLGTKRVPGHLVRWSLPTVFRTAAAGRLAHWTRPARPYPPDLIVRADRVLLGFDGVLARLYTAETESQVLRDVARLLTEERDLEDALSGRPLPGREDPLQPLERDANSLDMLRAFAGHELAREIRVRVDLHDVRAADQAPPVPSAGQLVTALHAGGAQPAVVTDRAREAAVRYLERHHLLSHLPGGVHGRGTDLTRLMPDPFPLHQVLDELQVDAASCVLVGSTVAELLAARAVGMPFIGVCIDEQTRRRLREQDGDVLLVSGLGLLVTAARYR